MGDVSKGVANTLKPAKKICKKSNRENCWVGSKDLGGTHIKFWKCDKIYDLYIKKSTVKPERSQPRPQKTSASTRPMMYSSFQPLENRGFLHSIFFPSHWEVTKQLKSKFFLIFCMLMEGSGSVHSGSGSWRPKNLRIRLRNTATAWSSWLFLFQDYNLTSTEMQ